MSNVLDGLLAKVDDPALKAAIAGEVARLRDTKQFGLVFERHLPETAKLTNHPIRRGALVQRRASGEQPNGTVTAVTGGKATVALEGAETVEQVTVDELVVVARFGDPIYPGLKPLGRMERGGDKPFHTVMNAENYHALQMLQFTHASKVDVIYIDPPYNLGGDLTYNDKRVAKDDAFRHSKWLSFMDRRLRLARELLKPTGAILVAIDDTEQAHLRLLMDQIFGEQNYLASVVWQGGRKNDSRYVSVGHDYMLVYAKSEQTLRDNELRWREPKPGVQEALAQAEEIWSEADGDHERAQKNWRKWLRDFKKSGVPTDAVTRYNSLHPETGKPIRTDRDISWPGGGGPRYDVVHPVTKKPCVVPARGWIYTDPARMQEEITAGRVYFGPDHTTSPAAIGFLEELDTWVPASVFVRDRNAAAVALENVMGDKRFRYPKDANVLARWISIATLDQPDAVVLDFFVGSGSTIQAVMELNAADGGRRQCIAVTNNEVDEKQAKKLAKQGLSPGDDQWEQRGIFEHVAKPRIETLVTGKRPDGTTYSDGLDENVEFFELTYQDPNRVARGRSYANIAPLLWLLAGATGPRIEDPCDSYSAPEGANYAVLFDPAYVRDLVADLDDREEVETVFIVTDSTAVFQQAVAELPAHVDPIRLYEAYLRNFEISTGDDL